MVYNFTHAKNNCKHKLRAPLLEVCANCGEWSTATIMAWLLQPFFFFFVRWRIPSSPYFSAEQWNTLNPTSHLKAPRRNILSHNKRAAGLEIPNVLPGGKASENSKRTRSDWSQSGGGKKESERVRAEWRKRSTSNVVRDVWKTSNKFIIPAWEGDCIWVSLSHRDDFKGSKSKSSFH